jgi:hypothetical protein
MSTSPRFAGRGDARLIHTTNAHAPYRCRLSGAPAQALDASDGEAGAEQGPMKIYL